jgi:pimeloyl-ACP methyl ester carboxylesterase
MSRVFTIDVAGFQTRVVESGTGGRTALLVPTMFALAQTYAPAMEQLVMRGFRVIAIELPGSGRSSKLPEPWNFDQYAAWLAQAVRAMRLHEQLPRLTIIGHSNSAAVVMTLAARHPELAGRIVLEAPVGAIDQPSLPAILMGRALDCLLERRLTIWGMPHLLFNLLHHPRDLLNQLELAVVRQAWRLPTITVPTLLALGGRDHTMPIRSSIAKLRQLIPAAQLYVSLTGSHDWIVTHAAEFAEVVDRFAV